MEITYRITQAEYLRALKLQKKSKSGAIVRTVIFWFFVLICLMMLWGVVQRLAPSSDHTDTPSAAIQSDNITPESV
ncbi:MAG: hypothetical protein WBF42_16010 [Terracidiphilus sp.]